MSDNAAPPNVQANDAAHLHSHRGSSVVFLSVEKHLGGAEKSLLSLLRSPRPPDLHPCLLCPPGAAIGSAARDAGLPVRELPMPQRHLSRQPWAYFRSLLRLLFLPLSPGAIFADGWRAVPYAYPFAKRWRCPCIVHLRECDLPPSQITRHMAASASLISTVSFAQQAFFREQGIFTRSGQPTPIVTVHNSLEPELYLRQGKSPHPLRTNLGLLPDEIGVALPGYLLPNKGGDDFLDAARILLPRFPKLRFFILGGPFPDTGSAADAAYPAHLSQRITSEGLSARVHLLGHRDNVPDILWAMDIVVVPTRYHEAFGRVALEAMFAGRPVIASHLDGLTEVVEDQVTGLLIPPQNPEALAQAISTLASDPTRRQRLGDAGRFRALVNFSSTHKAAEMWQHIQEVMR